MGAVAELLHLQKPRFTVITVAKIFSMILGAPKNSGALGFSLLALWLIRPWRGEGVRLRWTHMDGGGPAPCGCPHRKLKLESTDVILSHAKKLASFLPEFRRWREKNWTFFCDIN